MAIRSMRARVAPDRFELSFWDARAAMYWCALAGGCAALQPHLIVVLGLAVAALAMIAWRVEVVVTRETAWLSATVCGIPWARRELGRGLAFEAPFDELRVTAGGRSRPLVSWEDEPLEPKRSDARAIAAFARAQIERLHGLASED